MLKERVQNAVYGLSISVVVLMKDSTKQGVNLQTKNEDKEAITEDNEEKYLSAGLFGNETAMKLLLLSRFLFEIFIFKSSRS